MKERGEKGAEGGYALANAATTRGVPNPPRPTSDALKKMLARQKRLL